MKVNNKKKREKPEDFIGWKSPDGKLEVIGIHGKQGTNTVFKVTCTECSKDPELFPDGYFVSVKGSMIRGIKPCGCGKNVRWKDFQYLILARRTAKDLFIVHGFVDGYKGAHKTRFEYVCPKHGIQNISYNDFVHSGSRCSGCWRDKQKELGNGNGYFPERRDEQDFLYILDFDGKFIKVGRSFDVERRLGELQKDSGIQDIIKLRIFTATHQEIYDFEQELHNELRERNFQHYVGWSMECFENDCQYILNKLLDNCKLEEVIT